MIAIEFEQANIRLAEHQEEYETLPIYMDIDPVTKQPNQTMVADEAGNLSMQPADPYGGATFCLQLDESEIKEFNESGGKIWLTQSTFWGAFQPILMSTKNPFKQFVKKEICDSCSGVGYNHGRICSYCSPNGMHEGTGYKNQTNQ